MARAGRARARARLVAGWLVAHRAARVGRVSVAEELQGALREAHDAGLHARRARVDKGDDPLLAVGELAPEKPLRSVSFVGGAPLSSASAVPSIITNHFLPFAASAFFHSS